MLVNPSKVLQTVYKGLLLGMPQVLYSPFSNSRLHVPLVVNEGSTYVNFVLQDSELDDIREYIHTFNESLQIVPISLYSDEPAEYFLSINIYNVTSNLFMGQKDVTRCELNTYVIDEYGTKGTLIVDYITNGQSMDPITIFKPFEYTKRCLFDFIDDWYSFDCKSNAISLDLNGKFSVNTTDKCKLSDELIEYTDNIFYKDGILDKLYYDTSLTNADVHKVSDLDISCKYRDISTDKCHSIFYFKNNLRFVGSMWDNIYKIRRYSPTWRHAARFRNLRTN